jgi:lysyl-tRNA synthetase class 2
MSEDNYFEQRLKKLESAKALGEKVYSNGFRPSHTFAQIVAQHGSRTREELEKQDDRFTLAGRILIRRDFGKTCFFTMQDGAEKLQWYIRRDRLSQENGKLLDCLDVGDILGGEGRLFRTRTGELTLEAARLVLLVKSLRPLPEKWHGLADVETRHRQRYVDLIVSPEVRKTFRLRSQLIRRIRSFLDEREFQEVETPMMQTFPGGATAQPFQTHHQALGMDLYLRIAPELYLKRLVVGGLERVYEINRNFRNEGISTQHNPEFTMLEFYQAYATYEDLMQLTEELFSTLAQELLRTLEISYQGEKISFRPPFQRIRFVEALEKIGGVSPEVLKDQKKAVAAARSLGVELRGKESLGKVLVKIFEKTVEEKLIQPTFIYDFPIEASPLSKRKETSPEWVERFELYVARMEMANAFSELNDPIDQKERFLDQVQRGDWEEGEARGYDEDFVTALEYGMPPTAGEGIGVDRLAMLLTDSASIRDVILFPLLRPKD